jgi:hypothetical protein
VGRVGLLPVRVARETKEIRSKALKFHDSGFEKQVITGRRWRIDEDIRHKRGSGGKRIRRI